MVRLLVVVRTQCLRKDSNNVFHLSNRSRSTTEDESKQKLNDQSDGGGGGGCS